MAKDKKFGKGFFCGILTSAVVVLAGSGMLQQGGWITGADQKEAGQRRRAQTVQAHSSVWNRRR